MDFRKCKALMLIQQHVAQDQAEEIKILQKYKPRFTWEDSKGKIIVHYLRDDRDKHIVLEPKNIQLLIYSEKAFKLFMEEHTMPTNTKFIFMLKYANIHVDADNRSTIFFEIDDQRNLDIREVLNLIESLYRVYKFQVYFRT